MWNVPLTNGIALSVAIGCTLFLFGLSLGFVIAGVCWAFIAASGDRQASPSWESYPYINDDEIDILIELVRDAVAGSGWMLCGDCYTRNLLLQLQQQEREGYPRGEQFRRTPQKTASNDDTGTFSPPNGQNGEAHHSDTPEITHKEKEHALL